MRSLVAAFLIPLFVALPVTQVLAQAQQEPQVTSESMGLLSTPVVDSNTVLLLAPGSMEFSPATDSLPALSAAQRSTGEEVAIVVAVILGVVLIVTMVVAITQLKKL
jgi:hypothetical protein